MNVVLKIFFFYSILFTLYSKAQYDVVEDYYKNGTKFTKMEGNDLEGYFVQQFYENGILKNEVKSKTIIESDSLITTSLFTNGIERKYIDKNGLEVGVFIEYEKNYGRYFKFNISIVNNTNNQIDFLPISLRTLRVGVRGEKLKVRNSIKQFPLFYPEYLEIVKARQFGNTLLAATLSEMSSYNAGLVNVSSNSTFISSFGSGIYTSSTTFYSPALVRLQRAQNMQLLNAFFESESERLKLIEMGYIRENTIFPNEALETFFYMPFNKKVEEIDLFLMVGDTPFQFDFEDIDLVFEQ